MPKNQNRIHRARVYTKCNFTCMHCGLKFRIPPDWDGISMIGDHGMGLEIDHIKPRSKGGSDRLENKQALCWKCNNTKSDKYEILPT